MTSRSCSASPRSDQSSGGLPSRQRPSWCKPLRMAASIRVRIELLAAKRMFLPSLYSCILSAELTGNV